MAINGIPAAAEGPYEGGVVHNGMQLIRNKSTSASLVPMVGPRCGGSPLVGLQGPQSSSSGYGHGHGGLEVAVNIGLQGSGQKRPYWDGLGLTVEDGADEGDEGGEDCSPLGSQLEKKRRLTFDQVRSLEENFEMENKLEPERKMQLAKDLGLRPRQVAVWFQNRRARWKTKQLERDYELLAQDYKRLKTDYEKLVGDRNILRSELQRLTKAARPSPTVDVTLASKDNTETSGSSNSSDVVDAESPRTTVDSSSNLSLTSDHREHEHFQEEQFHPSSPDFPPESCFMVPNIDDDAAVKLEEDGGSGSGFNDVDPSYSYLLPLQLYDQSGVLPWWD